jgi:hypothetical protein
LRNPLLGFLALGDVFDDREEVLRLLLAALDGEPAREHAAHAAGGGVDLAFVEHRLVAFQELVLARGDPVGFRL